MIILQTKIEYGSWHKVGAQNIILMGLMHQVKLPW